MKRVEGVNGDAREKGRGSSSRRAVGVGFASCSPRTDVSLGCAFERVVALPVETSALPSRALSHPASAPCALASLANPQLEIVKSFNKCIRPLRRARRKNLASDHAYSASASSRELPSPS